MTNPAAKHPSPRSSVAAAIVCGLAGVILFQFFGNATRGYIPSTSLFYWWGFQWVNPGSETEHGWLILGLSVWVWWRNLSIANCGLRIAEISKPEAGEASPESGNRKPEHGEDPETGGWKPESGVRKPEDKNLGQESGNRSPETGERRPTDGGPRIVERKSESENGLPGGANELTASPLRPFPASRLPSPVSCPLSPDSGLRTPDSGLPSPVPCPLSPVPGLRPPVSESPQSAIRNPQSKASILPAVAAMVAGLAVHALGFAAQQTRLSIFAFLVFTWGVVRLGGGRRWGDAAKFPLAFMVFAIPISALDEIGLPLRLWVTDAGERIAHFAGIDVVRSGTQLVAPDGRFNYDVAAPCSGVRSLMALTALSVLIGYLNFRSWWRRALVLGLSLPLVYLGNVARIVAIIFAAQVGGTVWGDRAHDVMGYGVFVIVLGGVLGVTMLIRRWMPETPRGGEGRGQGSRGEGTLLRVEDIVPSPVSCPPSPVTSPLPPVPCPLSPVRPPVSRLRTPVFSCAAVLFLIGLEMLFLHRLAQMPPRGQVGVVLAEDGLNPAELPAFLGTEWIGQRAQVSEVEREILPPDTGFSRKNYAFVADRTRDVFLSIVLSGRDRTSIHRPELCLVGQGWTIEDASRQTFHLPAESRNPAGEFQATVLRVRREVPSPRGRVVVPQLVAYWFVAGDTIVASHWKRFLHDAWNRVARARADRWAYVLMQTDARDGEAAALARMQTVLDGTLPAFQRAVASGGQP